MRKIKKINGYLVVKFNDRELREWDGSALGNFGVIDAELYTGNLGIDRGAMEYDDAGSLEEAVELARGLDAEEDYTGAKPTATIIRQTDEDTEEDEVNAQLMINGWEETLTFQVESNDYPEVTPATARHQMYGFKAALTEMGLLDPDECRVEPSLFESAAVPGRFWHLPPEKRDSGTARQVYALGKALAADCPMNDCRVYLNIFDMCRELDEQAPLLTGWARQVVEMDLDKHYLELEQMYLMNYAIRQYKKACT